jgi:hypothetical protein
MEDAGHMGQENDTPDFQSLMDDAVFDKGNSPSIDGNLSDVDDTVADAVFPLSDKIQTLIYKRRRHKQPARPLHFPFLFSVKYWGASDAGDLPGEFSGFLQFSVQRLPFSRLYFCLSVLMIIFFIVQ